MSQGGKEIFVEEFSVLEINTTVLLIFSNQIFGIVRKRKLVSIIYKKVTRSIIVPFHPKKTKGTGKPLTDYEKASRGTVTLNIQ